MKVAKLTDTGKIVEVVRTAARVGFSNEPGWVLIDPDMGAADMTGSIRMNMRWIPSSTRFEWVRDFMSLTA